MQRDSLAKTYFLYLIILVILVIFRILTACNVLNFFGDAGDYIFTIAVQIFVLFGLSIFGFAKLNKKSIKQVLNGYGFQKISFKSVFLCLLIGIVIYFLNSYIATFFYELLSLFGYSISGSPVPKEYPFYLLIINLIFTAVLPGICEETVHRGMLFSEMKKKSVIFAIVMSSLLFGLLHINIYQFFYASILGVILAILTLSTQSIFPAMIVHFMNNALNVYFVFAHVNNLFSAKVVNFLFSSVSTNSTFGFSFYLLFFLFLLFALYVLYVELVKETAKKRVQKFQNSFGKFLARKIYFEELDKMKNGEKLSNEYAIEENDISIFFGQKQEKNDKKHSFYSKLFLFGAIFLSSLTTLFTFIWGII